MAAVANVLILIGLLVLAGYAWRHSFYAILAISLGALGGLVHELAQSKGTIFLPQKRSDGEFYLGSISGAILGAAAGALAVQTILTTAAAPATSTPAAPILVGTAAEYLLAFTAFAGGLALKGIAEAITTTVPADPTGPPTRQDLVDDVKIRKLEEANAAAALTRAQNALRSGP
ncbi:MAG: hypothetical protein QOE90_3018 [Thermoplasmata archaeon]|jgi:hypothetical protein|nr:hypothetical protein [Thermoplasmata archaeon]